MTEIDLNIPKNLKYKLTDDAIKALTEHVQIEFKKCLETRCIDEEIMIRYQKSLDKYMMDQYPDLSNRLNSLSLVLDDQIKQIQKSIDSIKKREKLLVKSESLYEDFYNLKDRVRVLDDFIITLKSNLRKAFSL